MIKFDFITKIKKLSEIIETTINDVAISREWYNSSFMIIRW